VKKIKKIILLLTLLSSFEVLSDVSPAKVIAQDKAIYRIENQIYFQRDINKIVGSLKKMSCLRSSVLLKTLSISKKDLNSKSSQSKLDKILSYYKLKTLVLKKSAVFSINDLKKPGFFKCFGNNLDNWSDEEKLLARAEFFLRKKFDDKLNEKQLKIYLNSVNNSIEHQQFF